MKSRIKKSTILAITVASALLILVVIGCSQDSSPLSSSAENEINATRDVVYPELTDDYLASCLPEGIRIIRMNESNSLDDVPCSPLTVLRLARPNQVANLNIRSAIFMSIPAGSVSQITTVRMTAPIACLGIIDCTPHPFQFNNMIEISWDLEEFGIDEDQWDDLIPYYWNENTHQLEQMTDSWIDNDELVMHTDHFSRYIVAQRIGG